jgi:hypothetical protein
MALTEGNMIAIGEDAASVLLYLVGIAFPPALAFIAIAKIVLPLIAATAPVIISAVQKGESPFSAAAKANPNLGIQIKTLAARIPVNAALTASISHLDYVTMMLVAKSTKGFAVPGWTDQETQQWLDNATPNVNDSTFGG